MNDQESPLQAQLSALLDGQLEPDQAERLYDQLLESPEARRTLEDFLQLEALTEEARKEAKIARFKPKRGHVLTAAAALTALAAGGLFYLRPAADPAAELFATLSGHQVEGRLTLPLADRHRPFSPLLSGETGPSKKLLHQTLAILEERGDHHALAAAYLWAQDPNQAQYALDAAPPGPDTDSDRAAVALYQKRPEEALALADRALAAQPDHPQATWNRALALRNLEFPLVSATVFESISTNDAWAQDAAQRAQRLRGEVLEHRRRWYAADAAGKAMVRDHQPPERSHLESFPGLMRVYFLDALRTAQSAEECLRLQPVAEALETPGREDLRQLLRQVAADNFEKRTSIGQLYQRLLDGETLSAKEQQRLLQTDLLDLKLGAWFYTDAALDDPESYATLSEATQDPWFLVLAQQVRAQAAQRQGRLDLAEQALLAAYQVNAPDYRLGQVEIGLVTLYIELHRLPEARRILTTAWDRNTRSGEWGQRMHLYQLAGTLAFYDQRIALGRAYWEEAMAREPERCDVRRYVEEHLAAAEMRQRQPAAAQKRLSAIAQCEGELSLLGAWVSTAAARTQGTAAERAALAERLQKMMTDEPTGGRRALARAVLGSLEAQTDPALAEQTLEPLLLDLRSFPRWDTDGQKARAAAYGTKLAIASARGEHGQVLRLMAQEFSATLPERCTLGVAIDDERRVLAYRDAQGQIGGLYDPAFLVPVTELAHAELVPQPIIEELSQCPEIAVFARPPLVGRVQLLPPHLAWHFRMGSAKPATRAPRHFVAVAEPNLLPRLGLEHLPPYEVAPQDPPDVLLKGADATPSRVLAAMHNATEIELYTHGWHNLHASDTSMLVLSMEPSGRYTLTAKDMRDARLEADPLVLLTACRAAETATYAHEPWSLPVAFLRAGARAVVASPEPMPALEGQRFAAEVRARVRAGASPAQAVRDIRKAHATPEWAWTHQVLIFAR